MTKIGEDESVLDSKQVSRRISVGDEVESLIADASSDIKERKKELEKREKGDVSNERDASKLEETVVDDWILAYSQHLARLQAVESIIKNKLRAFTKAKTKFKEKGGK